MEQSKGSVSTLGLVSIGVGGMVGGGIFSVLGLTAQKAGGASYLAFLVGGAVAALTGASYARLSVSARSRGGTASYLDRAFDAKVAGPLNLLLWLSYFVMLGLYASAFGSYLSALLGHQGSAVWGKILGTAVVLLFAGLNLASAGLVSRGESVLVGFKLVVLLVFCAGALGSLDASRIDPGAYPSWGAIIYAGALIFLGYEGFELIANAAEDARDPERSLPRAYGIAIGFVIALYVLVAIAAVGNLTPEEIQRQGDYALAAAAEPAFGTVGFTMIGIAAVVSTASAINATLYGAAKFTYLMARHGELPTRLGEPIWNRPVGGLLATAAGTILIVNTVDVGGISLMGSSGFLIVFGAVNIAAFRLAARSTMERALAIAGALACLGCLAALIAYAARDTPEKLPVLGALLAVAVGAEAVLRWRGARAVSDR